MGGVGAPGTNAPHIQRDDCTWYRWIYFCIAFTLEIALQMHNLKSEAFTWDSLHFGLQMSILCLPKPIV